MSGNACAYGSRGIRGAAVAQDDDVIATVAGHVRPGYGQRGHHGGRNLGSIWRKPAKPQILQRNAAWRRRRTQYDVLVIAVHVGIDGDVGRERQVVNGHLHFARRGTARETFDGEGVGACIIYGCTVDDGILLCGREAVGPRPLVEIDVVARGIGRVGKEVKRIAATGSDEIIGLRRLTLYPDQRLAGVAVGSGIHDDEVNSEGVADHVAGDEIGLYEHGIYGAVVHAAEVYGLGRNGVRNQARGVDVHDGTSAGGLRRLSVYHLNLIRTGIGIAREVFKHVMHGGNALVERMLRRQQSRQLRGRNGGGAVCIIHRRKHFVVKARLNGAV